MNTLFIRLDCDNVGDKIEMALYNNEPEEAQKISDIIKLNIGWFTEQILDVFNAKILLIGSDDILFTIEKESFNLQKLDFLRIEFYKKSQISISIGIGNNIRESLTNLHIAKVSGKNKIVSN